MRADATLPEQLREMAAEICALLDSAPFAKLRAEKILADALGLVEDSEAAWQRTVDVLEERVGELEESEKLPSDGGLIHRTSHQSSGGDNQHGND